MEFNLDINETTDSEVDDIVAETASEDSGKETNIIETNQEEKKNSVTDKANAEESNLETAKENAENAENVADQISDNQSKTSKEDKTDSEESESNENQNEEKDDTSAKSDDKNKKEQITFGYSTNFDLAKLDKKSREILEDTDETDYTFKLEDFEGPLDLLVHLIKIAKVDIRDIFISNITEQYLKIMEEIKELDFEKASEFINMAATLLELKSKHLLPKDPELEIDDGPNEEDFFRMVEEYKLIKDEMAKLAECENVDRFYKLPDSTVGNFRYELPESLSIDALISAFSNLMQKATVKAEAIQEKKIEKDKFTVSQKIAQIKDMLLEREEFLFVELFSQEDYTRSEVINTFLALLELLKRQYIFVEQESLFNMITIKRNNDTDSRLTDENIGSEYDGEE